MNDDTLMSGCRSTRQRVRALAAAAPTGERESHPLLWSVLMLLCFVQTHDASGCLAQGLSRSRVTGARPLLRSCCCSPRFADGGIQRFNRTLARCMCPERATLRRALDHDTPARSAAQPRTPACRSTGCAANRLALSYGSSSCRIVRERLRQVLIGHVNFLNLAVAALAAGLCPDAHRDAAGRPWHRSLVVGSTGCDALSLDGSIDPLRQPTIPASVSRSGTVHRCRPIEDVSQRACPDTGAA